MTVRQASIVVWTLLAAVLAAAGSGVLSYLEFSAGDSEGLGLDVMWFISSAMSWASPLLVVVAALVSRLCLQELSPPQRAVLDGAFVVTAASVVVPLSVLAVQSIGGFGPLSEFGDFTRATLVFQGLTLAAMAVLAAAAVGGLVLGHGPGDRPSTIVLPEASSHG